MSRAKNDCCSKVVMSGVKLFDQPPPGFLLKSLFDFRLPEKVRQLKPCVVMSCLNFSLLPQGHGSFRPIWGYFYDTAPSGFVSANALCQRRDDKTRAQLPGKP